MLGTGRWIAALLVGCAALAGCQEPEESVRPTGAEKIAAAEVRTDREPIEKRFPQLGAFTGVHWLGGTLGDDRVPGPSTYFIEAAVELRPEDAAALRQHYAFAPAADPRPPAQLAGHLGGSGWTSSTELDRAVSPSEWGVRVHLRPDRPVAYLSALGQ
jgi:hypothetical protein